LINTNQLSRRLTENLSPKIRSRMCLRQIREHPIRMKRVERSGRDSIPQPMNLCNKVIQLKDFGLSTDATNQY